MSADLILRALDFEYVPPCEEPDHLHDADWFVRTDMCEHVFAWCNQRFIQYQRNAMFGTTVTCLKCRMQGVSIEWWQSIKRAPKMPLG